MEHTKHIVRAALLLVLVAVTFVIVRHFAIPATFGVQGHYRLDSVAEYTSLPLIHGAPGACAECHEEEAETHSGGIHASVSCEVCHAPLTDHVKADEYFAEMPVNRSHTLCGRCHQQLAARRKDFPQVALQEHVIEQGEQWSENTCLECHDAHSPRD